MESEELFSQPTFLKMFGILSLTIPPLWCLQNSRGTAVRSENWRKHHFRWHVTGAFNATFCVLVAADYFDTFNFALFSEFNRSEL